MIVSHNGAFPSQPCAAMGVDGVYRMIERRRHHIRRSFRNDFCLPEKTNLAVHSVQLTDEARQVYMSSPPHAIPLSLKSLQANQASRAYSSM